MLVLRPACAIMDSERTVRVAVRVTPIRPEESAQELPCIETEPFVPNATDEPGRTGFVHIRPNATDTDIGDNAERITLAIQLALPHGCTQQHVYAESVSPLVQKFLHGYDASFIAYGQRRTGKTYTMFGPGFDCVFGESEQGIVQRAVRDIFADLMKRQHDCRYSINCTWIEVLGNDVQDMAGGRVIQCQTINDVFHCIQIGLANRCHEQSHTIFTLTLEQQWISPNGLIQHRLSTASFYDLGATDRVHGTGHTAIPQDCGLHALDGIVATLTDPNYVACDPNSLNVMAQYDETMLSKLLRDSFGGRAYMSMIVCVSPLERDLHETVPNLHFAHRAQFIRNAVSMNTFSDNNMPIGDFIDPMLAGAATDAALPANQLMPVPLTQALHYYPAGRLNAANVQNGLSVKFATLQWLKLVSNAEGLFSKLLTNGKLLNEQDRGCIEEWMYLKQECEECLSSSELAANQRSLAPIQETDEQDEWYACDMTLTYLHSHPCDFIYMKMCNLKYFSGTDAVALNITGSTKGHSICDSANKKIKFDVTNESSEQITYSENESGSEDSLEQEEYLEERVIELMVNFSADTDDIINASYNNFIDRYPNAITHSMDNAINADDASKSAKHLPSTVAVASAAVALNGAAVVATGAAGNGGCVLDGPAGFVSGAGRRFGSCGSNGDRLTLSRADLERLQRVADEGIRNSQSLNMENSVCREAAEFLDSSTDMHPLRIANANRVQDNLYTNIRKLWYDVEDKEKRIDVLRANIADTLKLINEHTNGHRNNAKRTLKSREIKLKAERDKCKRLLETKSRHDKADIQMLEKELNVIQKELNNLRHTQEISAVSDKKNDEYQTNLQKQQKELKRLTKAVKKDRKTLNDLEGKYRHERLKDMKDDKRSLSLTTNMNTRLTQLDCVLKEKKEHLRASKNIDSDMVESIRHEIRNLRDQRHRLTEAQCVLAQKLKKEKRLSERDKRQILECDVAKEAIDHAMEQKTMLICGRDSFIENPDLMGQLGKLNEREMRILLYKCFQKIADLRESSRQLEIQVIQLEHERTEWELRELNLLNRFEQMSLEKEQHALHLGKQYEEMFTKLLQAAANGYAASSPTSPIANDMTMMLPPGRNHFLENMATDAQPSLRRHHAVNNGMKLIQGKRFAYLYQDELRLALVDRTCGPEIHMHIKFTRFQASMVIMRALAVWLTPGLLPHPNVASPTSAIRNKNQRLCYPSGGIYSIVEIRPAALCNKPIQANCAVHLRSAAISQRSPVSQKSQSRTKKLLSIKINHRMYEREYKIHGWPNRLFDFDIENQKIC